MESLARLLPAYHGDAAGALAGAEAMLDGLLASRQPAVRWYVVTPPALMLGASQRASDVDLKACRTAGIKLYKRAAGGTLVLADSTLAGLDVALPIAHPLVLSDVTQSYRWLGSAWREALRALELNAELVTVEAARADQRAARDGMRGPRVACFGGLSPYEVTVGGRKVVGLAQVRRRHGVLLQSAVLLRWTPEALSALVPGDAGERGRLAAELRRRAAGLDELIGYDVSAETIVETTNDALSACGLASVRDEWSSEELARTEQLRVERYGPIG